MSLALYIILAGSKAPEVPAWNAAMAAADIPIAFETNVILKQHSGFLPAHLKGQKTGLYFVLESYPELLENYPALRTARVEAPVVYSLGYGGQVDECALVFLSAFTLVAKFNGFAFDPDSGRVLKPEEIKQAGDECLRQAQ
jgi:hypothetical protein